jgi:hypothetical protein
MRDCQLARERSEDGNARKFESERWSLVSDNPAAVERTWQAAVAGRAARLRRNKTSKRQNYLWIGGLVKK